MHWSTNSTRQLTAALIATLGMAHSASSHELWLDPEEFAVPVGQMVRIDIRVGENFAGGAQPYLPNRTERLEIYAGGEGQPVEGRAGDRPAVNRAGAADGLAVYAYETDVSTVRYREFEKFQSFVEHKDFDGALDAHAERGLSTDDFVETYSRHVKSLVAVGSGRGADLEIGLATEIIALDNPYTDDLSDGMRVQVNYLGEPRPDVQVEIYKRPAGEGNLSANVTVDTVRTDDTGRAIIPVVAGHEYMLDAVVLREPPADRAAINEAVWDTLWANLTFSVPLSPIR